MTKKIRIGTRKSPLAIWQAKKVEANLKHLGLASEIVEISSVADEDQDTALDAFGTVGVFTKALDDALLNNEIDIAVHSLKDVPTRLPEGMVQLACVKRDEEQDVLVMPQNNVLMEIPDTGIVATGSARRKAFWKYNYPNYTFEGLRGNIKTRIDKVNESQWVGGIFSLAGVRRLSLNLPMLKLPFMIPAPGQGTIVVHGNIKNKELNETIAKINHEETSLCTGVERKYMQLLEGGCTAPIGCHVSLNHDNFLHLHGALLSLDGKMKIEISKSMHKDEFEDLSKTAYEETLASGGEEILEKLKKG